jgi:hypothetical protein
MATAVAVPPPTHREEKPARQCRECGAWLRTGNLSTTCDPCGTPPWEEVDVQAALDVAADSTTAQRRPIFAALLECMESAA